MYGYIEHVQEDICDYCGRKTPKVEPENACAEFTPGGKWICWFCQNHNPEAQNELYE